MKKLIDEQLEIACFDGNMKRVLSLIKKGSNNFEGGLEFACGGGHKDIALLMIEKGAHDFNSGLMSACTGGQKDLASFMIEKGADDFKEGLIGAWHESQNELALFMIENGADNWILEYKYDLNFLTVEVNEEKSLIISSVLPDDECISLYHIARNRGFNNKFINIKYIEKRLYLLLKYDKWMFHTLNKFI